MSTKSKICSSCGRSFDFRKKWEKNWESVKFCSDECRKNKNRFDYTDKIMTLLSSRSPEATICPSEVLVGNEKQDSILMEHVRRSARLLVEQGKIVITQKGRVVDPSNFKGPIRLKLKVGG
ncbi:MAG: DUF3253 domain-containing protein [Bdellovibrionales bacterium]